MPVPPAEISNILPLGVNVLSMPLMNNLTPSQTSTMATIKRDSSQQQLQQLQQYTQQQNQQPVPQTQQPQQLAKAQLVCRPNSHPFPSRTLLLESNKPVKIGRAIARTKVSDNNAIFDCKVLSRNHAELWYDEGKFFLKDTGSSNGTFINNQRLSQTCNQSEPFEVSSGDIVQFGVDVMENSRKETHGCIVATLKLFLPDGRETKASQSTLVGASNTKIPQVDLYRLNQYIQEAIQREQNLECKLMNVQKKIDLVRKSSSTSWQALVDEDRLLSRIDMLEKKLLCFSKPLTEDKLREEIMKLQNEKTLYQTSAKAALKMVYNERMEAIQKLSSIEKALCSTEDECSLLRDQLTKTQTQSQETNLRLDAVQNQLDDKCSDYEEKIYKKDSELKNLNLELNDLQERLVSFKRQSENTEYEGSQIVSNWLLKSDIKSIEGSDDIIKAICGDEEDEINLERSLTSSCSQIYGRMFALEKELNLLFASSNNNNINNNNDNDNNSSNGSDTSINLNPIDSTSTLMDNQGTESVPSLLAAKDVKDEENKLLAPNAQDPSIRDDNQNNVNNRIMSIQNLENLNIGERVRGNLKQLLALYAKLTRQLMEFIEAKAAEQSSYKAKNDEMSSQLMSFKSDLDSRPTQDDFDTKVQQCNAFRNELSCMREQVSCNEQLMEQLQMQIKTERECRMAMMLRCLEERSVQTDAGLLEPVGSTNMPPFYMESTKHDVSTNTVLVESVPPLEPGLVTPTTKDQLHSQFIEISTTMPSQSSPNGEATDDIVDDDSINNHPKVLYEDELIIFKEKCTNLAVDNMRLQRELIEMRTDLNQFHTNWLYNVMLKYLVPVLIIFVAYIIFLLK